MDYTRSTLVIAILVATAGCASVSLGDNPSNRTTTAISNSEKNTVTTVAPASFPSPPTNLTDESAKSAAIAHEEARLRNQLRNETDVTYFELGYVRPATATVLNESDEGLYVRVDATYSYATPNKSADGVPVTSLYHVNESAIRHVNESTR